MNWCVCVCTSALFNQKYCEKFINLENIFFFQTDIFLWFFV